MLLVDLDPQGSLSQGFLGPQLVESLPIERTVASLFDQRSFFADSSQIVMPTAFDRITICPANQHLAPFNTPKPESTGMFQFVVQEFIAEQEGFDIVLIDCPPNLYRCSWTAMVAASYVIIPVPPEDFGTQGLRAVHQSIQQVRRLNPQLRRLGHLITRCDQRLLVHRMYEQRLRNLYSEMVLETVIPEASAFKVSLARRRPVEFHEAGSKAAVLTRQLATELMDRSEMKQVRYQVA